MQASAYFLPAQHQTFIDYAKRVGLEASQLLRLLILHELSRLRVSSRFRAGKLGTPRRQHRGDGVQKIKVTARLIDPAHSIAYRRYVAVLGLGSTEAATLIAHEELRQRWLEKIVRGRLGSSQ